MCMFTGKLYCYCCYNTHKNSYTSIRGFLNRLLEAINGTQIRFKLNTPACIHWQTISFHYLLHEGSELKIPIVGRVDGWKSCKMCRLRPHHKTRKKGRKILFLRNILCMRDALLTRHKEWGYFRKHEGSFTSFTKRGNKSTRWNFTANSCPFATHHSAHESLMTHIAFSCRNQIVV